MTSLNITDASIPDLNGKVAVVTGGSSGIGYATACILAKHGATVHILDLNPPREEVDSSSSISSLLHFQKCDVSIWSELSRCILSNPKIDYLFANAGMNERPPFLRSPLEFSENGSAIEPTYRIIDVNFTAVLNIIKLGWHVMKNNQQLHETHHHSAGTAAGEGGPPPSTWEGGSIVLTSSCTAYAPELSIPVYSSLKASLVTLVRNLRHVLPRDNITINTVSPCLTNTPLVPASLSKPVLERGLPFSTPEQVGLALVWSAVGREDDAGVVVEKESSSSSSETSAAGGGAGTGMEVVDWYGKEDVGPGGGVGTLGGKTGRRWNGRGIVVMGDRYKEVEGRFARLRGTWLGEETERLTREQQAATDFRGTEGF
ncbi:MAG: hypothetical protein MMC33_003469 [Icmadophila ericetorum]|nr:hypothetical protein [Icmadophila ericetorum]